MSDALVTSATKTLFDNGATYGSKQFTGIGMVTGSIVNGQTVTISGNGFGAGPTVVMFEDFSSGIDGQDATIGTTNFDDISSFWPPIFTADSRSGSLSARMFRGKTSNATDYSASINKVNLGAVTEVFVSFAIKTPTGKYFPGTNGGNSGTNADYSDSSWKTAWLLGDGSLADPPKSDSGTNDLVIPSNIGSGIWSMQGNDLGELLTLGGTSPAWWNWNQWNRMSSWIKAGDVPNLDIGNAWFQVANTRDALAEYAGNPVVFANGGQDYKWHSINFAGWIRPGVGGSDGTGADIECLYDDIYVAAGPNAAARVELGNASSYDQCTDLAICDSTTWTNSSITVNCREGGLNLSQNTWLYVTLADNTTRYSYQVVSV